MRIAVLDLGSTSFHLLVADVSPDGSVERVLRRRELLHLGEAFADGFIGPERGARAVDVVRAFHETAGNTGAEHIVVAATSAIRDAEDGPELVDRIADAAGASVRLLDGHEEARLALAGARAGIALGDEPVLALDLGGGSLELACGDRHHTSWTTSLDLGVVRLAAETGCGDPLSRHDRRVLRRIILERFAPIASRARTAGSVVAGGGAVRALARSVAAHRWVHPPSSVNGLRISRRELRDLHHALTSSHRDGRLALPGVTARRADLMPVASTIVAAVVDALHANEITVTEWGLREGLILEATGRGHRSAPPAPVLRERTVAAALRTNNADPTPGARLSSIARRLFESTKPAHGLGPHELELLTAAARLHTIDGGGSGSHKRAATALERAGLPGFSPTDRDVVSAVVRFHRGGGPKPGYAPLERSGRAAAILMGLIRIAHMIDRTGAELISVSTTGRAIELEVIATADGEWRTQVLSAAIEREVVVRVLRPAADPEALPG